MPSERLLAQLDSLADKQQGIFEDKEVRKNYYRAKKLRESLGAEPYSISHSKDKWEIAFWVYGKTLCDDLEGILPIYVIKEIITKKNLQSDLKTILNYPGTWYCSYCGRLQKKKFCEHIFIVVFELENPLIILKDKAYILSKLIAKKSWGFLKEIIDKHADRIKMLPNKELLVIGKKGKYKIKYTKKEIAVYEVSSKGKSYCVRSGLYDLAEISYPIEDILVSLILFLLNDTQHL